MGFKKDQTKCVQAVILGVLFVVCDAAQVRAEAPAASALSPNGAAPQAPVIPSDLAGRQSCDNISVGECVRLAEMYEQGLGVIADVPLASRLYYRAGAVLISVKSPLNCQLVICTPAQREAIRAPRARGSALIAKACALKYADACIALGVSYEVGDGVVADVERARDLYRGACEAGASEGCWNLGMLYTKARDEPNILIWMKRGCELGSGRACDVVGAVCVMRAGSAKDLAAQQDQSKCARDALTKACDAKLSQSCLLLATAVIQGKLGVPDKPLASESFKKACALGAQEACAPTPDKVVPRLRRTGMDMTCMDGLPEAAFSFLASAETARSTALTSGCVLPEFVSGATMDDLAKMGPLTPETTSVWCCPSDGSSSAPTTRLPVKGTGPMTARLDGKPMCSTVTISVTPGTSVVGTSCDGSSFQCQMAPSVGEAVAAVRSITVTSLPALTMMCGGQAGMSHPSGSLRIINSGGQQRAIGSCSCESNGSAKHRFSAQFDVPVK